MSRPPGSPILFAAVLAVGTFAAPLTAQTRPSVESARRLSEAGAYAQAVDTLRAYLHDHPDDTYSHRTLGRLLYWLNRHEDARGAYETALHLGAGDPWIRVELARVLVALGAWDEARTTLQDALDGPIDPSAAAAGEALLGSLAWWNGDDSQAARRFEEALRLDPNLAEARAGLDAIRSRTRPWVSLGTEVLNDNQPVGRWATTLEGGYFPDPLWELTAAVTPVRLDGTNEWTEIDGRLGVAGRLPAARIQLTLDAGGATRTGSGGGGFIGLGSAAVRLGMDRSVSFRAAGWRERYTRTEASIDTLIAVEAVELAIDRAGAPRWAFEAAARFDRFPDGNRVRTGYGWLLAPVLPWFRAGYAFSWSDAAETRWTSAPDPAGPPGGDPRIPGEAIPGRYDPYFTPEETVVHSLLAEVTATPGAAMARLNLNLGVRAREQAPYLTSTGPTGPARLDFVQREFRPWEAEASLDLPVGGELHVRGSLQHRSTAFYDMNRFVVELVRRFGALGPPP